jgi:TetR/AcrR family transcriptional regulator, transcriptional repressor of bet genes
MAIHFMADCRQNWPRRRHLPAALKKPSRTEKREIRRQQLIDATLRCISKNGIGGTKLSDVAQAAGLSQGIVNLHFASKDNLLRDTLNYLAEDYRQQFESVLERSGPAAADKLKALMEMDFKPSICDRRKLAVWFAFWGEVKAVPTYQKICEQRDQQYGAIVRGLCRDIIAEGNYAVDSDTVATALSAMTEGLWLSCLINPKNFSREAAMAAVYSYLQAVFPQHYN